MSTQQHNPDFHQHTTNPQQEGDNDCDVDIPQLVTELQHVTTSTTALIQSIEECLVQSTQSQTILAELTSTLFADRLAHHVDDVTAEVQCVVDLFSTLQVKVEHLLSLVALLPAFEKTLDAIIANLPTLQKKVTIVVAGLKSGKYTYKPPQKDQQLQWHDNINGKYQEKKIPTPHDMHNTIVNDHHGLKSNTHLGQPDE